MASILAKYRKRLEHKHGWRVPLVCNHCGHEGVPRYDGWTPSTAISFGDQPTIYADLFCEKCGQELRNEAGAMLVGIFSRQPTDMRNRRLLWLMIAVIGFLPLLLGVVVWLGVHKGMWGPWAFSWFGGLMFFITPATMWISWRIASIRNTCECGKPDYLFMGMLGRSYCYRCSACGRLLRIRD